MYTYNFRLYPDKDQRELLWKHANKLNATYNYFLHQRIEAYEKHLASGKKLKNKVTKGIQQAELVKLKAADPELAEIHSQVVQQVTRRLQFAYENFFRRVKLGLEAPGFPKFRPCHEFFGICYPQSGFKITDKYIWTAAYGKISYLQHRKMLGNIKRIFITCDENDHFYISILTDYNYNVSPPTDSKVAIDLGTVDLYVTDDGYRKPNCSHAKFYDKKIDNLKSRISKLKKGSRKRRYLGRVKRRLYGAKTRKINDFQHKASRELANKYDTVYAENLSVKNMLHSDIAARNKNLQNAKLGQFLLFLKYKVKNLVLVNPYNTSKTCNNCGKIHDIKLSVRSISCSCGITYDRDENAAKNILCLGQAIQDLSDPDRIESMTIQEALTFK